MKKTLIVLGIALLEAMQLMAQQCEVKFNLNYDTTEQVEPISVKQGYVLPLDKKPLPQRDGYRFGGWYTTPECKPEQEWRFGTNSIFPTPNPFFYIAATDSMGVEKPMMLYAKWVSPKPIKTVKELDAIREDLYGWYVLENDLDLSDIKNWIPIGKYEASYEWVPGEWWRYAFKGVLDGQGHTIRNMQITQLTTEKSGLFGTIVDGEVMNLKMENSRIDLKADKPYVAPISGVIRQDKQTASIHHCQVTGTLIKVTTTNTESTFHSFTGLCGGAWGGTLENNHVSGRMEIVVAGNGGGELYVGSYLGEAHNTTINCTSDFDIKVHFKTEQPADGFYAYIGGLQAASTNIQDCFATGSITLSGKPHSKNIRLGGIAGSALVGTIENSISSVKLEVKDMDEVSVGGILGEFNTRYAAFGAAFGNSVSLIRNCTFNGAIAADNVQTLHQADFVGTAIPDKSPKDNYKIENCIYEPKAQPSSNTYQGKWYGVSDKAPVTLTIRPDGTFSLVNEAFSGMTMEGKYTIDGNEIPAPIDLTEMGTGMDGLGLIEVSDGVLNLLVSFGPKGYVQRPKQLDASAIDLSTRYFSLNRDSHTLDTANSAPATIPAAAQLAFERNKRLGAGICLNGVLDGNSFRGTIPDMPLTNQEIKAIADAGFKSVRLCVTWTKHCMSQSPYTIDPAFFKKVDDIVERCLANGLAVSIDTHYYPYINMDNVDPNISYEENFNRLSLLWEQIATYFKDKPNDMVFFDLLNEPNIRMGADKWNETFNTLIKLVRKTNPERTLIISTPNLGQHWTINQLELPADDWNLIVQVHYYLPHTFTHQGLSYARAEGTEGTKWQGTETERKPIEADLDYCYRWSRRNGRPIYVGEYGVVDDADTASRATYMGYMKHEMEKRGFSSHIWGFREAFGFFDTKTNSFDQSILNALRLHDLATSPQKPMGGLYNAPETNQHFTGHWGDQGDGTYRNPVLAVDFSDPDPIRVGNDFYMAASTFESVPGVTILHSTDLVNWEILGGVFDHLDTYSDEFQPSNMNRYNEGVYAPSLRYHNGKFYVYVNFLTDGMFVCTAENAAGPWHTQRLLDRNGKELKTLNWTDPCPIWDEEGNGFLATSRPGGAYWYSYLFQMNKEGTQLLDGDVDYLNTPDIIYEYEKGGGTLYSPNQSSEGNKLYWHNGYYYLVHIEFLQQGAGTHVYRSKYLYGVKPNGTPGKPGDIGAYETYRLDAPTQENEKSDNKNPVLAYFGPLHAQTLPGQGGLVDTPDGKWFYMAQFTDGNASGRQPNLVPVTWIDGWPVVGVNPDNDLHGKMVWNYPKPIASDKIILPQQSDDFNAASLQPFWTWNHQPDNSKWSLQERPGYMRLYASPTADGSDFFFKANNTLNQRSMRCEKACVTVKMDISHMKEGQRAGIAHFNGGMNYALAGVVKQDGRLLLLTDHGESSSYYAKPITSKHEAATGADLPKSEVLYLRTEWDMYDKASFSWSVDGQNFHPYDISYLMVSGNFRGDMTGVFTFNNDKGGYVDIDDFNYQVINR